MVADLVAAELDRVHERIAGRFARSEPRARVREYVSGLVAGLERKNGWTLAERAGEVSPDGMQRLLRRADWDTGGVRDDVRDYVAGHLGDRDGVLIADETGFVKKGTRSAGVQRQDSGTAGRTENCQIGVFLAYASVHGHALIDRELYLPASWAGDRDRCRAAGIPGDVEFATKPRLAQQMLQRAIDARVPFAWFTADEVYGQAKYLHAWLEERDVSYVLAIKCNDTVPTPEGGQRADALIAAVPSRAWQRLSAGAGAHGPREYDWARIPVRTGAWRPGRGHWLLARRSISHPDEIAYYACYGPRRSTVADLAWIAGSRWHIEMVFTQLAKRAVWPVGRGREHVADLDLVAGDDHPVDEQLGQLPPLLEGGGGEPGPDGLAECLDAVGDGLQFQPLPGGGVQLSLLGRQGGLAAVKLFSFALEFGQADDLGQVGL